MNKSLRIYLDHGEAYGNLGDEAMLLSALERLERHLGPCEFILPTVQGRPLPELPANVTLVPAPHQAFYSWVRPLWFSVRLARRMPRMGRLASQIDFAGCHRPAAKAIDFALGLYARRLLSSPGAVLRAFADSIRGIDAFYGVGAACLNDFNASGLVYKSWLYKAVRPQVRVSALSAQGFGPLHKPWTRRLLKQSLEHLDLLTFRDYQFSHELVTQLRPRNVRFQIIGDEAFSLPPAESQQVEGFLRAIGLRPGDPFIAFHFRRTDYTQDTSHLISRLSGLLDTICDVIPDKIVFFPMSYDSHSTIDEDCGLAIQSLMKQRDRFIIAPLCKDIMVVRSAIGHARYSLGLSYHVHVFSLSQGHPALILYSGEYYRYKSEGLVGFYGSPSAALNLQDVTLKGVLQTMAEVERNYETACSSIARRNEWILARNDWMLREMANLLERN